MALILSLLIGCGPVGSNGNTTSSDDLEVNCDAMTYVPILSVLHQTRVWAEDTDGSLVRRCEMITSPTVFANEIPFVSGGNALDLVQGKGQNQANLQVTAFGETWISVGGALTVEGTEGVYTHGTYEATGWQEATDAYKDFHGTWSWCTNLADPSCPWAADVQQLDKTYSMTLPHLGSDPNDGQLTFCRMAWDPDGRGLQVDAELGTWMGQNTGQIWTDFCSAGGAIPPQANYLRFRAGGVDGPGTYQADALSSPSGWLPELYFTYPGTFEPGLNDTVGCDFYTKPRAVARSGGSCTWEVQEDPGQITIDCDDVHDATPGSTIVTWSTDGPMHFEADCDLVDMSQMR